MQEEEDFGRVGVALCEGEEVEVVVADVEILSCQRQAKSATHSLSSIAISCRERTFIPSSEKHGGTAELSSSASERRTGNFSTADMGMSPL